MIGARSTGKGKFNWTHYTARKHMQHILFIHFYLILKSLFLLLLICLKCFAVSVSSKCCMSV
jgi:hypothetical protein